MTHVVTNILLRHNFNLFPWAHQENKDNCKKREKKTKASLLIMVIGLIGVQFCL